MSLQLEESSSDISDGTISDNGTLPVADDNRQKPTEFNHGSTTKDVYENNEDEGHTLTPTEHTNNEYDDDANEDTSHRLCHDSKEKLTSSQQQQQHHQYQLRQNIERTITNSHPLMVLASPTGSDSDRSLKGGGGGGKQQRHQQKSCHNFPDVVPHREHLQSNQNVPAPNSHTNHLSKPQQQHQATTPSQKLTVLRRPLSPDLLSSESELDLSQYHATVESNYQVVALIPKTTASVHSSSNANHQHQGTGAVPAATAKRNRLNKGAVCGGASTATNCPAGYDDISSLDSISNHSFDDDEDIEHNLASLSPSSSLIDGLDDDPDDDDDDDDDCEGPELMPSGNYEDEYEVTFNVNSARNETSVHNDDNLPQYTEDEERRDSRNWQKVTLPDGKIREIDMRVIEPYKRVLSHGGYLKAGGHNAIVIFCACHLPDRSRADYSYVMDNLFLYVVKTLEQLVTEDYVLIYLHGGSTRRNVPPFPWLKKCYQMLDRRLRKSLKNMYLVHPTFWIKSIVWMARPFVSSKFWRKLVYVKSLEELSTHVAVEKAAIPDKVKQYDIKHN